MIRPSILPKLALCPQFEGSEAPSPAAERGSQIDVMFRELLAGCAAVSPNAEDLDAAKWAANYVRNRCGAEEVFASESACKISTIINGLEINGTMDAVCPDMHLVFDLKTGMIRDYRAQMAAYALACMEKYGTSEWTAVLVFADQREIRQYEFHHWAAKWCVSEIVAKRTRQVPEAIACDYCGWCAKKDSCYTLHEAGNRALNLVAEPDRFAKILENPVSLSAFLDSAQVVERWVETARETAKSLMRQGVEIPGWRIQERRGRAYIHTENLIAQPGCDVSKLVPATVSEKTAREALPSLADSLIERGENVIALVKQTRKTINK